MNLLLKNYLKFPAFINFHDLKNIITSHNVLDHKDSNLNNLVVNALIHSYKNDTSNFTSKLQIGKFVSDTANQLQDLTVDEKLTPVVDELQKYGFPQLPSKQPSKYPDMDPFKFNGLVLFEALCRYVASPFPKPVSASIALSQEYLEFCHHKQQQIETYCVNLTHNFRHPIKAADNFMARNSFIHQWLDFATVLKSIKGDNKTEQSILKYENYLKLVDYDVLVELILSRMISHTVSGSTTSLYTIIGRIAYSFHKLMVEKHQFHAPLSNDDVVVLISSIIKLLITHCEVPPTDFPGSEKFKNKLFIHEKEVANNKTYGTIKLHPLVDFELSTRLKYADTDQIYLPMLVPPKPWTSPVEGGYLNNLKPIINAKKLNLYVDFLNQVNKTGQLNFTYDNLNFMSQIPWCINKEVLSVFNQIIDMKDGFLGIPPTLGNIPKVGTTKDLKLTHHRMKSKRFKYNILNLVSNSFKDQIFYFPHLIDFRGRVYPLVSVLSYQDEDVTRSLLQFYEAKPLGKNGLDWVKYQLAGLYGKDKLPREERIQFVDDSFDDIIASAKDPLTSMWWKKGDSPWQVLRHCIELEKISRFKGNMEDYKCRIPIHQDGTCNGLQHYAALSRDASGGKAVNLCDTNERQDIYTEVLKIVELKLGDSDLERVISKLVSRKLIKRPIMTQVYGVTMYGAADQLLNEFHNIDLLVLGDDLELFQNNKMQIVNLLAKLIFLSITDLFKNLIVTQKWFYKNCLRVMVSVAPDAEEKNLFKPSDYRPMMWTTLSGFPVIQLYDKQQTKILPTGLQSFSRFKDDELQEIDFRKQLNGVAPNYIHSLDAMHLLLTCFKCREHGIPFVAVHDSFWSYPKDADQLGVILRQEFFDLHSKDLLKVLHEDMTKTISDSFHLVWIKRAENKKLCSAINKCRNIGKEPTQKALNSILYTEMDKNHPIVHLVNEHKPKLYIKRGFTFQDYDGVEKNPIKYIYTQYLPVVIPATVLDPPPYGELQLEEVLQSKYFFS